MPSLLTETQVSQLGLGLGAVSGVFSGFSHMGQVASGASLFLNPPPQPASPTLPPPFIKTSLGYWMSSLGLGGRAGDLPKVILMP